jgi:hypothetical protein
MTEHEKAEIEHRLKTIEEYLWQIRHILEKHCHEPKTQVPATGVAIRQIG